MPLSSVLVLVFVFTKSHGEGVGGEGGHSLFREITLIKHKDVQNIGKKGTLMVATAVHCSRGLTVYNNISR